VFGRPLARGGRRSSPVHLCSTHKVCGSDDKTPATTSCRLPSAQLGLAEAINTAAEQAIGRSNLTSLEIDLANGDTVVWHLDQPVLVGDGAVDDQEGELVVVIELGPLAKVLRIRS
jgi:hypothetical protein